MTVEINIVTLLILLVTILVATILLVTIWQITKTSKKADALLGEIHQELLPTLRDCREIAARIKRVSATIEQGDEQAKKLLAAVAEITDSARKVGQFFRHDAFTLSENAALLILGLKAASKVFFQQTRDKGE